jgi:hypothetical protein
MSYDWVQTRRKMEVEKCMNYSTFWQKTLHIDAENT